ncbi:hypothetical protein FRB96_006955 [Tulasnella sp. 330]|nr:hypothetical protein FRB96_006955 [Tulasnella sp. 330]KAG8873332.1 hypothetical protein FRB97_006818 [Tulasnella sp. 331]KAG8889825.1 hypothetical protein FRB98_002474 [Tulasnella sp. 332]
MANEGDKTAISRVLDQAFGRRGRLRRQLTSHLTSNSPEKSISHVPNNPRLSPPLYSASVSTLLTSQLGRVAGKALSKAALNHPPNLPARANPSSDDARLMGRFSLRREANIRWRFFTDEVHKQLQPPLVVRDAERDKKDDGTTERDQPLIEKRKGTGSVGLEKVFIEMERVAAAASNTYQLSAVATTTPDTTSQYPLARDHSEFKTTVRRPFSRKTRYFRRHVAEILSRTPILVETPSNNRLSVTTSSFSRLGRRPPVATAPDIAWIEYANGSSVKRA